MPEVHLNEVDLSGASFKDAREMHEWCVDQKFKEPCEALRNYDFCDGWQTLLKFNLTDDELAHFLLRWQY